MKLPAAPHKSAGSLFSYDKRRGIKRNCAILSLHSLWRRRKPTRLSILRSRLLRRTGALRAIRQWAHGRTATSRFTSPSCQAVAFGEGWSSPAKSRGILVIERKWEVLLKINGRTKRKFPWACNTWTWSKYNQRGVIYMQLRHGIIDKPYCHGRPQE